MISCDKIFVSLTTCLLLCSVVTDPPVISHISGNKTVNESDVVTLNCTADGKPAPNVTWTRLSDNSVVNSTIHITSKQDEGVYRCTADNGVGDPVTAAVYVTVQSKLINQRPALLC